MVGDPSPGDTPPGDPQRCLPTPFLSKTYSLVEDRSIDEIISWNDDGSGFIVWNPTEFARDLLPKYFKHNNFSSFVRQLNTYGFRKVVPDRWEFSNDSFRRGEKRLLCDIQRRKVTPHIMAAAAAAAAPPAPAPASVAAAVTIAVAPPMAAAPVVVAPVFVPAAVSPSHSGEDPVISSTSSPVANQASFRDQSPSSGCSTELIDENDRLRRENMQLTRELSQMKIMCDNIYSLMTNYAVNRPENGSARPLDLLMGRNNDADNGATSNPMTDGESCTRIFGFPVGAKRMRESEYRDGEREQDLQLRLGGTSVKSEPSERDNTSDDHEYMWPGMSNGTSRKM